MLSELLKTDIESYYDRVRRANPLFENARRGRLTRRHVGVFLKSVHYLIRHTPIHLKLAHDRAEKSGMRELAKFFRDKVGEEAGHDKWAEADLATLSLDASPEITPGIRRLVAFIAETIQSDPALYLPYILFAEYFTVLAGSEWIEALDKHCGIKPDSVSVIGNHVELDKDHIVDDLKEIDLLVKDEDAEAARFRGVLDKAMRLHEAFCAEVGSME